MYLAQEKNTKIALLEALFMLQCGLVPDNQRVTWTAVAILAMFVFIIKHDLVKSCSQLWPIIGNEGDKISKNNTMKLST